MTDNLSFDYTLLSAGDALQARGEDGVGKKVVALVFVLILTVLAAQCLPGYLDVSAQVVQERMMLGLLPILLIFIWWTW